MKKILILMLCFLIINCTVTSVFAEDVSVTDENTMTDENANEDVIEDGVQEDSAGTEASPLIEDDLPSDEIPGEPSGNDTIVEEDKLTVDSIKSTVSGAIKEWIEPHLGEIGVIVTLIGYGISLFKKFKTVNKNMGTMNNNAISIAENSSTNMNEAKLAIKEAAAAVTKYEEKIDILLKNYESTAKDKKHLEAMCVELKEFLDVSTLANKEFANELMELLALSNIPNFKKEEIGARHLARVNALDAAEEHARRVFESIVSTEEVKENVTEEA